MTLSHCWGGDGVPKLTNENIQGFRTAGIPLSLLPRTFLDAIAVATFAGIPYIWIDSLCIIQKSGKDWKADSGKDWEIESALMDKVYLNSFCNIAATASVDSYSGCFSELLPNELIESRAPVQVICEWQPGFWPGTKMSYTLVSANEWEEETDQAPLNKRGWVLQECMLSARSVHFASGQVYWSCQTLIASELSPDGLHPEIETLNHQLVSLTGSHLAILQDGWRSIISNYTQRSPSWSWASVQGQVYMPYESTLATRALAKLLDFKTQGVSEDLTGAVSDGFIRLQCRLFTLSELCHLLEEICWDPGVSREMYDTFFMGLYIDMEWIKGLLLRETKIDEGTYRRVGMAKTFKGVDNSTTARENLCKLMKIHNPTGEKPRRGPLHKASGWMCHTITIF